jgi:hypothetical protein
MGGAGGCNDIILTAGLCMFQQWNWFLHHRLWVGRKDLSSTSVCYCHTSFFGRFDVAAVCTRGVDNVSCCHMTNDIC